MALMKEHIDSLETEVKIMSRRCQDSENELSHQKDEYISLRSVKVYNCISSSNVSLGFWVTFRSKGRELMTVVLVRHLSVLELNVFPHCLFICKMLICCYYDVKKTIFSGKAKWLGLGTCY